MRRKEKLRFRLVDKAGKKGDNRAHAARYRERIVICAYFW